MNAIAAKALLFLIVVFKLTNTCAQTSQQVENAIAFTKLFGYVKYFHPSDEAAGIDWNRLAIFGSGRVSICKNTNELQKTLTGIFKPIAPTLQIFPENTNAVFNKAALMVSNPEDYNTIAWQHLGAGLGKKGSVYKSARTSRPIIYEALAQQAFVVSILQNAVPLQGKQFIYSGKVRLVNGDGKAQLWTRVDNVNKTMGFFDNMDSRPIKNKSWGTYEITGTIDTGAASIVFGAMLIGKGEIEFDDLSLRIKEGDAWKEQYVNSFSKDDVNQAPKDLYFNRAMLASHTIAVKKDDTGGQNLVSIKSKDILPEPRPDKTLFKEYPEVGEYLEKSIGGGLKVMLPLAVYGTDDKTFPVADSSALRILKESLENLPDTAITGNNIFARLADLSLTWNIFQHFYPYFSVTKTDWNGALKEAIKKAYADQNGLDFLNTLRLMTATLKDGHIRVYFSENTAIYMPNITWEWIENELVVTNVSDPALPIKKGDIVKKIDNLSAQEHFARIYPTISAATKGWLASRAQTESLVGERGSIMKLSVIRNSEPPVEVAVTRNVDQITYYGSLPKKDSIKTLPDNMMYVNIGMASMETINKKLPELQKSRVIICDLRGYPNNNHAFIEYLLKNKDTSRQWMQVPRIIYPDQERIAGWQNFGWELKPAKTHLDAKIIFLIDGTAISYAESFMSFIENYKLATIIGQPTAGTNGNINPFNLPGDYSITWTGMKVQKHDGSTHHGVGILPNIYVQKTIKAIREGRDEFLEKAIEVGKQTL